MKSSKIIIINTNDAHYFVISIKFDPTSSDDNIFPEVLVYDSIKISNCRRNMKKPPVTMATTFLKKLQFFFAKYVLYDTDFEKLLLSNDEYILKNIDYKDCPNQTNGYDCSLFAYAITLHLVNNVEVKETTFIQEDITRFRFALGKVLSVEEDEINPNPRKQLSKKFLLNWFKDLAIASSENDLFLNYYNHMNNPIKLSADEALDDNDTDTETIDDVLIGHLKNDSDYLSENDQENDKEKATDAEMKEDHNTDEICFTDDVFVKIMVENNVAYQDFDHLDEVITEYEKASKCKLAIKRSKVEDCWRQYACVQHTNCTLRASFGRRRNDGEFVCKSYNNVHKGVLRPNVAKGGRKWKDRRGIWLNKSLEEVVKIKSDNPVAKDIVKASNILEHKEPTYDQAWRALHLNDKSIMTDNVECFKLILPYLNALLNRNQKSLINANLDDDEDSLSQLFVCPGDMNSRLRFVLPMISLDAAHLKGVMKGTLYVATVKNGANDTLPIAFGLAIQNEDYEGWFNFLGSLKEACPMITQVNPQQRCFPYGMFSFVSDRDKGLLEAVKTHFPNNHHSYCCVHIARNVKQPYGLTASLLIPKISKTFSVRKEQYLMEKLNKIKPAAYTYVNNIDPKCWKSSCWIVEENSNLPPRYGIVTSNMSESINNMLKKARTCNWLNTIHNIMEIIIKTIYDTNKRYKGKIGIIERVRDHIKNSYNNSAGFQVIPTDENAGLFTVIRTLQVLGEPITSHNLNVIHKTCTCGKWQEFNIPCIDAVAYLRLFKDKNLQNILNEDVSHLYDYATLQKLYKNNVNGVALSTIPSDGHTKPTKRSCKRQPGRPKTLRYRKRCKYENEEDSIIKCKICTRHGHNARTCNLRTEIDLAEQKRKKRKEEKERKQMELQNTVASATVTSEHIGETTTDASTTIVSGTIGATMTLSDPDVAFTSSPFVSIASENIGHEISVTSVTVATENIGQASTVASDTVTSDNIGETPTSLDISGTPTGTSDNIVMTNK